MRRLAAFVIVTALLVPAVPAGASKERLPRLKCGSAKRVPVAVRKTAIDAPLHCVVGRVPLACANVPLTEVRMKTLPVQLPRVDIFPGR